MRRVNWTFAIALIVIVVTAAGGFHVLHVVRYGQIADDLRWQVDRSRDEGRPDDAIRFASLYLDFRPDDVGMMTDVAKWLREKATNRKQRASILGLYERITRLNPDDKAARRQVVELSMTLGEWAIAKDNLEILLRAEPGDSQLCENFGYCQQCIGRYNEAAEWYRKAVQADPHRIVAYLRLAVLYQQQLKQVERVIPIIDEAIAANPNSAPAYVAKAQLLRSHGQLKAAAEAIRKSREIDADDAQGLIVAADIEQSLGNYPAARQILEHGATKHADNSQFVCGLAWQLVYDGRTDLAIATLRRAKEAHPKDVEVLTLLGDLLAQDGQVGPLESTLKELIDLNAPNEKIQYIQARLQMRRGKWADAATTLDRLRMNALRSPTLYRHANLLLAQCRDQLGDRAGAIEAYRRLLDHDPNAATVRMHLASELARDGQFEDALTNYLQAITRPDITSRVLVEATRTLVDSARTDPKSWSRLEKSVETLKPDTANINPILARAYLDLARQRPKDSLAAVDKAVEAHPRSAALHVVRSLLNERVFGLDRAEGALADAELLVGDHAEIRIARARLLARRMDPALADGLAALSSGIERFNAEDRARILQEVVAGYRLLGEPGNVARCMETLSTLRPDLLWVRESRFARALKGNDETRLNNVLSEVTAIEGKDGACGNILEALRLIWSAQPNDESTLARAEARLNAAARERPKDPTIEFLRGRIDELSTRPTEALRHYRAACDLGLVDRPIEELISLSRGKAGNAPVTVLRDQLPLVDRLRIDRNMTLLHELGSLCDAASLQQCAERIVANSLPADAPQQIWLGRLFANWKLDNLADAAFRKAAAAAPQSPDGWMALASFQLARSQGTQIDQVRAEIREKLPPIEGHLIVGRALESAGQSDAARREYESASSLQPEDTRPLRLLASLDIRLGRLDGARKRLEQIVAVRSPANPADQTWARRTLAVQLASTPTPGGLPRALALINENQVNGQLRDDDLRAEVVVLASWKTQPLPGKDTTARREAIRILEQLRQKNSSRSPADLLQLARLYRAEGNESGARQARAQMKAEYPTHYGCVAYLAREALRDRDLATAATLIDSARQLGPTEFETVALDFQRQVLSNNIDQARRLLDDCVGAATTDEQRRSRSLRCANLIFDFLQVHPTLDRSTSADLRSAAIRLFGNQVERDPQVFQRVVTLLAQQPGGTNAALRAIEQGKRTFGVEFAATAYVQVLRFGQPDPQQRTAIQRFLQDALEKSPASSALMLVRAEQLQLAGEHAQAIAMYRRVLQVDPENILALNNLAWNLSLDRKDEAKVRESLTLIQRAIDLAGPLDELLDTRARILFESGQREAGLRDMCDAVNESPSVARWRDYANMLERAGNAAEARRAIAQAERLQTGTAQR